MDREHPEVLYRHRRLIRRRGTRRTRPLSGSQFWAFVRSARCRDFIGNLITHQPLLKPSSFQASVKDAQDKCPDLFIFVWPRGGAGQCG